jgi:Na+/H+-dicarboxylate symporter
MVAGVLLGAGCHRFASPEQATLLAGYFAIISQGFLRLIKMVIAPLVFATLVSGIANVGSSISIGRIAFRALVWFLLASAASLIIGLVFVDWLKPGVMLNLPVPPSQPTDSKINGGFDLKSIALESLPSSVVDAMATNAVLQILVFSLFFGVALRQVDGEAGFALRMSINGLMAVMLRVTNQVMRLAPVAVLAALASAITLQGYALLSGYGKLIGSFYLALGCVWVLHLIAGYCVLKKRLWHLLKQMRVPLTIAFSTASSEAAYPKVIESLRRFGVDEGLIGLVLPLGYSFNLVGSMIYQACAAIFLVQAFQVPMSLGRQSLMLLVLMLNSKGMAGVPRGSVVILAATLPTFGLPAAGILLLTGIDQILDMGRSATNAMGNCVAAAVLGKWQGATAPRAPGPARHVSHA